MTPRVIVLSAPSGAGKTTIATGLLKRRSDVGFSVSATTRAPRPGEQDGVAYHFLTREEFARRRDAGEFAEWAEYAGNWYGTLQREISAVLGSGKHVVLDIEIQGARQVAERYPSPRSHAVFILPPSAAVWKERLVGRGTESKAVLVRRWEQGLKEIRESLDWRHIIINEALDRAVTEVSQIIDEDGAKPHRPSDKRLQQLVEDLVHEDNRLRHGT